MSVPVEHKSAEYEIMASPSAQDSGLVKPPTAKIGFTFGAVTNVGKVRNKNEDHFLVSQFSRKQTILATNIGAEHIPEHIGEDAYSIIVADGMGGMAAGEVASRMAITTGIQLFAKAPKWGFKINKEEARELLDRVNVYLREIDLALTERSESDHRLFGMGTTLTAAYSIGVDVFIIHVGDSRAYLERKGQLKQLTKDHTVAQAMADAGYISSEEVRRHTKRNVLTNFLGGHRGKVKADVHWLRLAAGDRLLLCSDGLTDMLDDTAIARVLAEDSEPAAAAQRLVDEALECGGKDNVTVVVARYAVPSLEPAPSLEARPKCDTTDSLEAPGETLLSRLA
jgi:PPM family protein phosphatase